MERREKTLVANSVGAWLITITSVLNCVVKEGVVPV
jgi:hypothetical protein